jgi:hypothetical protein
MLRFILLMFRTAEEEMSNEYILVFDDVRFESDGRVAAGVDVASIHVSAYFECIMEFWCIDVERKFKRPGWRNGRCCCGWKGICCNVCCWYTIVQDIVRASAPDF